MNKSVDVLILGGGLTGASLLLALQHYDMQVLLVDAHPVWNDIQDSSDPRHLALAPSSIRALEALKIWPSLYSHASPIRRIHVSQRGTFGTAHLAGTLQKPLGYIAPYTRIAHAIYQGLPASTVICATFAGAEPETNTLTFTHEGHLLSVNARVIVVADPHCDTIRQQLNLQRYTHTFAQHAVTAQIRLQRSHDYIAYERFTDTGPLAMLPCANNTVAMVWCVPPDRAKILAADADACFLRKLQDVFGYRLGRMLETTPRQVFPLMHQTMPHTTCGSFVFIGNAAHTLHPVAGQGYNLALRDVGMLAESFVTYGVGAEALHHYAAARAQDTRYITQGTYYLVQGSMQSCPGLSWMNSLGLMAFDQSASLKAWFGRYARGFGGHVPLLSCGVLPEGDGYHASR